MTGVCNSCGNSQPVVDPNKYLFVFGMEDNTYMNWQLEMFIYTATKWGKESEHKNSRVLPSNICPVIYGVGEHSNYLTNIINYYGIKHVSVPHNFGRSQYIPQYRDGQIDKKLYVGANKLYALGDILNSKIHEEYEYVVLLDTDIFVLDHVNFHVFPRYRSAISWNWLINEPEMFLANAEKAYEGDMGVNLYTLMKAMNVEQKSIDNFCKGSVFMFIKTKDLTEDFVNSLVCWKNVIWNSTFIVHHPAWIIDMPCYSLAFASTNTEVETLHLPEFDSTNESPTCWDRDVPSGSFIHYAHDKFGEWDWGGKFPFKDHTPFDDEELIASGLENAPYYHAKKFFEYCKEIGEIPVSRPKKEGEEIIDASPMFTKTNPKGSLNLEDLGEDSNYENKL